MGSPLRHPPIEVRNPAGKGHEISVAYFSLLESAKLAGVEPKLYLLTATRAALADPKVVTLPRDLAR